MTTYGSPEWARAKRYDNHNWRKLRHRLLRAAWRTCESCGNRPWGESNPLQVYHTYYLRDQEHPPWEYPDSCFKVLCKSCHEDAHRSGGIPYHDTHPGQY